MPAETDGAHVLYGMSCSYFTGKLEAYLQAKGIPFRSVELDRRRFKACAEATGVAQLPCVETPDGDWLTDTTAILDHFEAMGRGPALRPGAPAAAFCSLLLEDLFDEWFWRPALYYRWAFDEDAKLMSSRIARTLLRDVPLPLALRRRFVLYRQRWVYLRQDGVTRETAPAIESLYLEALGQLDAIFARRPFLLGERPCEADFGLFGPFFRHFFCDPTPGQLMRDRAPHVAHWVTRLWQTRPADLADSAVIDQVPDDLGYLFEMVARDYLPYLEANARAVTGGEGRVRFRTQDVDWQIPVAPYRVDCLNALRQRYAELDGAAKQQVKTLLPESALASLAAPAVRFDVCSGRRGIRDRLWRPASGFA